MDFLLGCGKLVDFIL